MQRCKARVRTPISEVYTTKYIIEYSTDAGLATYPYSGNLRGTSQGMHCHGLMTTF